MDDPKVGADLSGEPTAKHGNESGREGQQRIPEKQRDVSSLPHQRRTFPH
jgi:hypothetical protein